MSKPSYLEQMFALAIGDAIRKSSEHAVNTRLTVAVKEGMKHGIEAFAWWKDGIQYVGSGVKTLKEALEEIDRI